MAGDISTPPGTGSGTRARRAGARRRGPTGRLERPLDLVRDRVGDEPVARGVAGEVIRTLDEVDARRARGGQEAQAAHGVAQEPAPELGLVHEPAQRLLLAEAVHLAVDPELQLRL